MNEWLPTLSLALGSAWTSGINLYATVSALGLLQKFGTMKKSEINIQVELDINNLPKNIKWDATDKDGDGMESTKSLSLNIWDNLNHSTLRIDLWTDDMSVVEMKRFYIDIIGGMAQTVLTSTGDEYMAEEMKELCDRLVKHVNEENSKK